MVAVKNVAMAVVTVEQKVSIVVEIGTRIVAGFAIQISRQIHTVVGVKMKLDPPFPYMGGKSSIASEVWDRFGDVRSYFEPFAGSLAVMLARTTKPGLETVNDTNSLLVNFWRAVKSNPEKVAAHVDIMISEVELRAKHSYLVQNCEYLTEKLIESPEFCDAKSAAWWVWGLSCWIGDGWCNGKEYRKRPSDSLRGVNRTTISNTMEYLKKISARVKNVIVLCGDWSRALPGAKDLAAPCGVFLDPPYRSSLHEVMYSADMDTTLSDRVRAWAIENGAERNLRIALCGLEGEHEMPQDWTVFSWRRRGGYEAQSEKDYDEKTTGKERIWFSPNCLQARQTTIFQKIKGA